MAYCQQRPCVGITLGFTCKGALILTAHPCQVQAIDPALSSMSDAPRSLLLALGCLAKRLRGAEQWYGEESDGQKKTPEATLGANAPPDEHAEHARRRGPDARDC
jgi:hypothetical protein